MSETTGRAAIPAVDADLAPSMSDIDALVREDLAASVEPDNTGRPWLWRVVCYGLLILWVALMVAPTSSQINGIAAIAMMLTMMAMKIPIAISMITPATIALAFIYDWEATSTIVGEAAYEDVASWSLSVVPMFIFMGMMLWKSGITSTLFTGMGVMFNKVPASLAVGTNVAGGGLAAVSGSTMGTTYALARVAIPEMLRAGYDKRIATTSVLMAGLSGQLIPPSILLVIFAGIAAVPVGPQLLAGIGPGVVLVIAQAVALILIGVVAPKLVGGRYKERQAKGIQLSRKEKLRIVSAIWPIPVMIVIVIGGMFSGYLTETEAGAAGALAAILLTIATRGGKSFKEIWGAVVESAATTAGIFFLLIGAGMLTLVLADSGLADGLAEWVIEAGLSRVAFLIVIFIVYLILGMFMDTLAVMMLTVPVLMPLFPALGIEPLWFGVFVVLCVELGMITPPVGVLSYVVHSITKDPAVNLGQKVSLKDVFTGVGWLLPISLLVVAVMIAFPGLATYIPNQM